MSHDDSSGFAPPPFNADSALVALKRALRELKLTERGHAYELRGKRVVELALEDAAIHARLARRLALTPEWDRVVVRSATEQRKLQDEVKKRIERWEREE
ncbi:MAG TPA: hypothetical protein VFQ20_07950 [Burkholderiaceae bacterium]|nr:hypothetical protein [Burkholderiaceae bacterium]